MVGVSVEYSDELIRDLPKSDIHVHLGGSLRAESLIEMAQERGVELPAETPEGLRREVFKERYSNLREYLHGFSYTSAVLRDPDSLERAAYELCLKCSHAFNVLDARGAISTTERAALIGRIRALSCQTARLYLDQRAVSGSNA